MKLAIIIGSVVGVVLMLGAFFVLNFELGSDGTPESQLFEEFDRESVEDNEVDGRHDNNYYALALREANPNACNNIENSVLRARCQHEVSQIEVVETPKDPYRHDGNYYSLALREGNPNACNNIHNETLKGKCKEELESVSVQETGNGNASEAEEVPAPDPGRHDGNYYSLALREGNPNACNNIHNETLKGKCKEELEGI